MSDLKMKNISISNNDIIINNIDKYLIEFKDNMLVLKYKEKNHDIKLIGESNTLIKLNNKKSDNNSESDTDSESNNDTDSESNNDTDSESNNDTDSESNNNTDSEANRDANNSLYKNTNNDSKNDLDNDSDNSCEELSESLSKCKLNNYTVLTEEPPNICEINLMFKQINIFDLEKLSNDDIKPVILNSQFKGIWSIIINNINIEICLFKGKTSSVDYLLFEGSPDTLSYNAEKALCILESTKTSDTESRNTAVYQRITKFTTFFNMYPKSKAIPIMYYNDAWKSKITNTANYGLSIMVTLGIRIFCKEKEIINLTDKYSIKPFVTYDELISAKNNIKEKKGNTSVKINCEKIIKEIHYFTICIKLDKGSGKSEGKMSHDPNVGLLCGLINILTILTQNCKILIKNHGLNQTYFDKKPKSKFWYSIDSKKIKFENVIIKKIPNIPKEYFEFESQMTEKLSTILYTHLNKNNCIFSNHSGCALTYLKCDKSNLQIGREMHRPDIVFCNQETKTISIIEGKIENKIKHGILQLSNEYLKDFIKLITDNYKDYTIIKGLCITIDDIKNVSNYKLKYPILFALDNNGYYFIKN
jgi:hypothetical protein